MHRPVVICTPWDHLAHHSPPRPQPICAHHTAAQAIQLASLTRHTTPPPPQPPPYSTPSCTPASYVGLLHPVPEMMMHGKENGKQKTVPSLQAAARRVILPATPSVGVTQRRGRRPGLAALAAKLLEVLVIDRGNLRVAHFLVLDDRGEDGEVVGVQVHVREVARRGGPLLRGHD